MKLRMLPVAADRFVLLPIGIPLNVERSADGKVTGTATDADYDIIEDGEAGENMWKCTGKNVAITGTKI